MKWNLEFMWLLGRLNSKLWWMFNCSRQTHLAHDDLEWNNIWNFQKINMVFWRNTKFRALRKKFMIFTRMWFSLHKINLKYAMLQINKAKFFKKKNFSRNCLFNQRSYIDYLFNVLTNLFTKFPFWFDFSCIIQFWKNFHLLIIETLHIDILKVCEEFSLFIFMETCKVLTCILSYK